MTAKMNQRYLVIRKVHSGKHITFYTFADLAHTPDLSSITGTSRFPLRQLIIKNDDPEWCLSQLAELGDILSIPPDVLIQDLDVNGEHSYSKRGIGSYLLAPFSSLPTRESSLNHWKFELGSELIQFNSVMVASLCRSWIKGHCLPNSHFRRTCIYRHVFLDSNEEIAAQAQLDCAKADSRKQTLENYDAEDPHNETKQGKSSSGMHLSLNYILDREFAKFLIETFGKEFLSTGSGVFDVAGGKGHLSFELHCINRIPCTLIEPRGPLQLHRRKRKVIRKILLKEAHNERALSPDFKHIQKCFDQELCDRNESNIRDCSIIIGMHPDEACTLTLIL
jgi:hypothetical protein